MLKKILLYLCCAALGCANNSNSRIECFGEAENIDKSILYFSEESKMEGDNSRYGLSSFFDLEKEASVYLKTDTLYVNMNGETDEVLFSFNDYHSSKSAINIKHRNWLDVDGFSFVKKTYQVELVNIIFKSDQRIAVLRIINGAYLGLGMPVCNALVFFSDKRGFIGSYIEDESDKGKVINKEGDILEDFLDYSDRLFFIVE